MPGGGAGELPGAEHETPEAAPGESPAGRVRPTKQGRVDVEEAKRQRKAAQRKAARAQATKDSSQEGQEDKHPMMQHLEGLAAKAARATERARRQGGRDGDPPIPAYKNDGPLFGGKWQKLYEDLLAGVEPEWDSYM